MRAVNSVLSQKDVAFELIVVDDGSSDETASLLAPLVKDGLIKYQYQDNCGVSSARNKGLSMAQGDLLAFLDSDDEWLPDKLKLQTDFMKNNSYMISQCQERWMRGGVRVNPGRRHIKEGGDIFVRSLSLCIISPSAVILRRQLLDEVGLFDENLPAAEDYDLWLRVTLRYEVGLLDKELLIRYGGRKDQLSSAHSLDRFRIVALEKLLALELGERRIMVEGELKRRRKIYEQGFRKRQLI